MDDDYSTKQIASAKTLCTINDRVCPNPQYWEEFWKLLKKKKIRDEFITPDTPLILGSWHFTSDDEKAKRLSYHIHWSIEHDQFDEVLEYLKSLPESAWHHKGDVF